MIVWTHAVLGVLYVCVLYFCVCPCSAQLSMFHIERRFRNTLIIIIIIIMIMMTMIIVVAVSRSAESVVIQAAVAALAITMTLFRVLQDSLLSSSQMGECKDILRYVNFAT